MIGPARLPFPHQCVQAGVGAAKQRQTRGHGLDIRKTLRLAGRCADKDVAKRVAARHLGRRNRPGENHAVRHMQGLRLLFERRTLGAVADDKQHGIGQLLHSLDEFRHVLFFCQAAQAE